MEWSMLTSQVTRSDLPALTTINRAVDLLMLPTATGSQVIPLIIQDTLVLLDHLNYFNLS